MAWQCQVLSESEACQGHTSHPLDSVNHPNGHCCPCPRSRPGNNIARLSCHQGEGSSTHDTKGGGLKVSALQPQPRVRPHPTLKAAGTEITPGPGRTGSSDLVVEARKHRPPALPVFPGSGVSPRASVSWLSLSAPILVPSLLSTSPASLQLQREVSFPGPMAPPTPHPSQLVSTVTALELHKPGSCSLKDPT